MGGSYNLSEAVRSGLQDACGAADFEKDKRMAGRFDSRFTVAAGDLPRFEKWLADRQTEATYLEVFNPLTECVEELGRESGLLPELPAVDEAIVESVSTGTVFTPQQGRAVYTHGPARLEAVLRHTVRQKPRKSFREGQEGLTTYGFQDIFEITIPRPADLPERVRANEQVAWVLENTADILRDLPEEECQ